MSEAFPPPPRPPATRPQRTALTLLILGLLAFLGTFLFEDMRRLPLEIFRSIRRGDIFEPEKMLISSGLFMMALACIGSPILIRWLERSRLMTWLLRIFVLIVAGCFGYFLLNHHRSSPELILLTLAPTLTFAGLCLIRFRTPGNPLPR